MPGINTETLIISDSQAMSRSSLFDVFARFELSQSFRDLEFLILVTRRS